MPFHVFLLYALLISNVVLRLFTNKLAILPKALNIADVLITILLFLLSLRYARPSDASQSTPSIGGRLLPFNLVILTGALLNLKFVYAPAALSQIIMWNEPLLLFIALMRLPFTAEQVEGFRRILVKLLILECAIGVLQIPLYLKTGQTEQIIGTFYGNAEQYQGFMMLGVYYLLARERLEPHNRMRLWLGIFAILSMIILIDNKASWLGVAVSILYVLHLQARIGSSRRLKYLLALIPIAAAGVYLVVQFSPSLGKFSGLREAWRTDNFRNLGKVKAYFDIRQAFEDHDHMWLVGSGPGNFYSRSATQFYILGQRLFRLDPGQQRAFTGRVSNSMGGVINPTTEREPFYAQFYLDREIFQIGSGQVDSPFSSYAALLGETGLVGTFLYLSIYFGLFRYLRAEAERAVVCSPEIYPFAVAATGFLIYVATDSLYNHWLETGRMTTILWAMVAMLLKYHQLHLSQQSTVIGQRIEQESAVHPCLV